MWAYHAHRRPCIEPDQVDKNFHLVSVDFSANAVFPPVQRQPVKLWAKRWRIEVVARLLRRGEMAVLRGFRNFLMRGDVIVVAVGLSVALAFSNLVKAFTDSIINPLIAAAQGGVKGPGLGWQLVSDGGDGTYLNLGAFISAIIYFIIFMAVVYFLIVVPYKFVMARTGKTVFGEPPPTKTCPACLSDDLNPAATRCKHCGADIGKIAA